MAPGEFALLGWILGAKQMFQECDGFQLFARGELFQLRFDLGERHARTVVGWCAGGKRGLGTGR